MADYAPLVRPTATSRNQTSQTPKSFGIEAHFADSKLAEMKNRERRRGMCCESGPRRGRLQSHNPMQSPVIV